MELALYAPGLGYYSAGSAKIGAGGDFVTAPEVSDLFSRCVARQCAQVLAGTRRRDPRARRGHRAHGGDRAARAGRGRSAAGALRDPRGERGSARAPARAAAPNCRRTCASAWCGSSAARAALRGVILANEVADALPCRRFTLHGQRHRASSASRSPRRSERPADIFQRAVAAPTRRSPQACARAARRAAGAAARGLHLGGVPAARALDRQRSAPASSAARSCSSTTACRARTTTTRSGSSGTLRCHFRQRAHDDPCINVGVQDITAWVDFTRVAEAAVAAGLDGERLRHPGGLPAGDSASRRWWARQATSCSTRAWRARRAA